MTCSFMLLDELIHKFPSLTFLLIRLRGQQKTLLFLCILFNCVKYMIRIDMVISVLLNVLKHKDTIGS